MNYLAIILAAAKKVGVSGSLLFAICSHESANFTDIYVHRDGGSPSMGICMLKEGTARLLGYKGTVKDLEQNAKINAFYAASYLKYQEDRYRTRDWVILAAAYNAGSYNPSDRVVGCPRNLKYIKRITPYLPKDQQGKLSCGKK